MQIVQQQGQTIYAITKENYNQVLPKLSLSANVMSDIQNAINADKVVTVHEKNISYKGWHGSGYVILDPKYGTGAYLIGGGANGGFAFGLGLATSSIIATGITGIFGIGGASLGLATLAPFLLGILGPLLIFFAIMVAVTLYRHRNDQDFISCFIGGFAMNVVAFIGILFPNLGYISGFGAGASIVGTAGGCYGY